MLTVIERAGVKHTNQAGSDLRYSNVALRIEAEQNLKYLQNQLGHSSIQVTMDRYGHLLDTNQDAAIKLKRDNL